MTIFVNRLFDIPDTVSAIVEDKPKRKRKPKQNAAGDPSVSNPKDQCQTPDYAVQPLLPYLPAGATIWECAAGEGLLAEAVENAGHRVIRSEMPR